YQPQPGWMVFMLKIFMALADTFVFFVALSLLAAFVPEPAPATLPAVVPAAAALPALALLSALAPLSATGVEVFSMPLSALAFLSVVAQPFRKNPRSRINKVEYLEEERVMFKI
ncbi:MAG: hypothetical protein J0I90_00605, partial [Nitrosospira sp.]|nr:hypothetical protein [Nitrosospira sp.]